MRCWAQQQQQAKQDLAVQPPKQHKKEHLIPQLARCPEADVWIPISGPPSEDPPEMRLMQHPADVKTIAPTSITEVATPQQLAIGKREAREQAAALVSASVEIAKWKVKAEELVIEKQMLAARSKELEAQRNQSMVINAELLAAYKQMQAQLQLATQKVEQYQSSYSSLRQDLLTIKSSMERTEGAGSAAPAPAAAWPGGGRQQQRPAPARGAAGGGVADDVGLTGEAMAQLFQMSQQMALDAERDEMKRQLLKSELMEGAPPANGAGGNGVRSSNGSNGNGAAAHYSAAASAPAAAAATLGKASSNGRGASPAA